MKNAKLVSLIIGLALSMMLIIPGFINIVINIVTKTGLRYNRLIIKSPNYNFGAYFRNNGTRSWSWPTATWQTVSSNMVAGSSAVKAGHSGSRS